MALEPRRPDWPALVGLASANGLLVSIYPALEEHGLCARVPDDALAALREFHAQARLRRTEAARQIERVSGAMNAAGIEPLWLKGAALIVEGSPWADRRWMSDVDLWVARDRIEPAREALLALGYRHDPRYPDPAPHHLRPVFHPDEPFAVELHHALTPPVAAGIMPVDRVLGAARRVQWRSTRVLVPAARDQAVHIASQARPFARAYLRGRVKARRVVEFAQIAAAIGAEEAVDALRGACRDNGQREFAEEFLALCGGLCGLPGDFDPRAAMAGFAWKANFPLPHTLYAGFRSVARPGIGRYARHPLAFAKKVVEHLRLEGGQPW